MSEIKASRPHFGSDQGTRAHSRMLNDPFTPEEAEFLAEFTLIDIIPAANLPELDLIGVS